MGQTASCATSIQVSPQRILVVHMNGHVDEFLVPVKVKEVLSKHYSRTYFVCRWRDLQLHLHAMRQLTVEEELQKGEIYMVLPISAIHSDVSPRNLAAVGNRLLVAAKRHASKKMGTVRKAGKFDRDCSSSYCKMYGKVVENCENGKLETA